MINCKNAWTSFKVLTKKAEELKEKWGNYKPDQKAYLMDLVKRIETDLFLIFKSYIKPELNYDVKDFFEDKLKKELGEYFLRTGGFTNLSINSVYRSNDKLRKGTVYNYGTIEIRWDSNEDNKWKKHSFIFDVHFDFSDFTFKYNITAMRTFTDRDREVIIDEEILPYINKKFKEIVV